jgi:hypothetical protein
MGGREQMSHFDKGYREHPPWHQIEEKNAEIMRLQEFVESRDGLYPVADGERDLAMGKIEGLKADIQRLHAQIVNRCYE